MRRSMRTNVPSTAMRTTVPSTRVSDVRSPRAVVLNPVGPDLPGFDRGELAGLTGANQVGEEVGAVAELAGLEPGLQGAQDVLARVQALAVRPRPEVGIPALTRSLPLLVAIVQPAPLFTRPGQPGEAPPRGRLVEAFASPFDHDQDPRRQQGRRGQVQHAVQVSHVVQRGTGVDYSPP